jgi:hypothetical protein
MFSGGNDGRGLIPDSGAQLYAGGTLNANTTMPTLDMGDGFGPQQGVPVKAQAQFTAANFGTGDESYGFEIFDSPDGSTWTTRGPVVLATDEPEGPQGLATIPATIYNRYVELRVTVAGTAPSIALGIITLLPDMDALGSP